MVKTDWLRFYESGSEPEFSHVIQSWDAANKPGELNDYSVCTTWGVENRRKHYLLDVFRGRLDFPGLKKAAAAQQRKHDPTTVLVEDRASGTQLIQELKAEGMYFAKPYLPPSGSDKVMWLHAQTAPFESGMFFSQGVLPGCRNTSGNWLHSLAENLTIRWIQQHRRSNTSPAFCGSRLFTTSFELPMDEPVKEPFLAGSEIRTMAENAVTTFFFNDAADRPHRFRVVKYAISVIACAFMRTNRENKH
jgi:predicted phage terminase large subunit-like protein